MAWTRLVAVDLVRSARIPCDLGVGANMISDALDVGYVRQRIIVPRFLA